MLQKPGQREDPLVTFCALDGLDGPGKVAGRSVLVGEYDCDAVKAVVNGRSEWRVALINHEAGHCQELSDA